MTEIERLLHDTRQVIGRFAAEVEPRPWTPRVEGLELVKQVGALSECVLLERRYKASRASVEDFMNECSDVLYMVLRIASSHGLALRCAALADYGLPAAAESVEQVVLSMAIMAGRIAAMLEAEEAGSSKADNGPGKADLLAGLESLLPCLNYVARTYGFSLVEAHDIELRKADAWISARSMRGGRLLGRLARLCPVGLKRALIKRSKP